MPQTDARGVASLGVAPDPNDVAVKVTDSDGAVVGVDVAFYIPPPPQAEVTLSALGVPADGNTDVSGILPAALAGVAPGTRVICDAPRYYIANALSLPHLLGVEGGFPLVLDGGEESVFWRRFEDTRILRFGKPYIELRNGYMNAVLRRLRVCGPEEDWRYQGGSTQSDWRERPAIEFDAGLRIAGGVGLLVDECDFRRVGGDGIQVQGTGPTGAAQNVRITALTTYYTRRQAMALTNCQGVTVDGAVCLWAGRSVVDLEPYAITWYSNGIILRNVQGAHFYNYLVAAGGQGRHEGLVVEDCHGVGGLGFLMAGATDAVAQPSGVRLHRNRYTWDDPEFVQKRNLSSYRVRAVDPVEMVGNDLTFKAERAAFTEAAGGGLVRGNTIRGVRDGYAFDSLGAGPASWTHGDNLFFNRRNEPVQPTWA